jgi:hypothetical protein
MSQVTDTDIRELKDIILGLDRKINDVKTTIERLDKKIDIMDARPIEVEKKIDTALPFVIRYSCSPLTPHPFHR